MGILMLKKIRSCKSFGGPVKLGFSMWLPVLRSGKVPKVFPMSGISHNYNVLNDRSVPIHVLQLVGRIDHGGGCSIWQSGRMIQYWARRARNQGDLSSSMLPGESITYGMLQEIRLLDLHIKTKNAFCKYSGLQHRLQHSFKYTASQPQQQVNSTHC